MNDIAQALRPIAEPFLPRIRSLTALPAWQPGAVMRESHGCSWETKSPDGLVAQCQIRLVEKHHAGVLSLQVRNPTQAPLAFDPLCLKVVLESQATPYRGFRAEGGRNDGFYPPGSFRTQDALIYEAFESFTAPGGRSSTRNLPITMVAADGGAGLWLALEWSGRWEHMYRADGQGALSLEAKPSWLQVTLAPGQTVSLPRVHFGFFQHGFEAATNLLRRYLYQEVCALYLGRPVLPPLSYDHWFGIGNQFDQAFLQTQVDRAAQLGLEFFVLDAGWFPGGFQEGVGNWDRPDPAKFPHGLRPFADYVRARGLKFGLWFDVERAHVGTAWAEKYPDLFFPLKKLVPERQGFLHLDLSQPAAQDLVIDYVGGLVEELGIEWTRWDYNIDPVPYWEDADPSGQVQLGYMAGLYRVLDTLMGRYPKLFVENCASGGQRIDLAMMRRAHSCWFSDHSLAPQVCRYMQLEANRLLPAQFCNSAVVAVRGASSASFSEFDILSRMAGALSFDGDIAAWSPALTQRVRKCCDLFKQVRHLLVQDYYRLFPAPVTASDWDGGQFVSYDQSEAVVLVYRTLGEDAKKTIRFQGLAPAPYAVTQPLADQETRTLSGQQLTSAGLEIALEQNQATVILLRKQ
jgi:alpha-galactosidase